MKYKKLQVPQTLDTTRGKGTIFTSLHSSSLAIDIEDMGELISDTRRLLEKMKYRHEGEQLTSPF